MLDSGVALTWIERIAEFLCPTCAHFGPEDGKARCTDFDGHRRTARALVSESGLWRLLAAPEANEVESDPVPPGAPVYRVSSNTKAYVFMEGGEVKLYVIGAERQLPGRGDFEETDEYWLRDDGVLIRVWRPVGATR